MVASQEQIADEPRYAFEQYPSFEEWKKAAKPALVKTLGLDHWLALPRCPIVPETLWKRENDLGTIEKLKNRIGPFSVFRGTPRECTIRSLWSGGMRSLRKKRKATAISPLPA